MSLKTNERGMQEERGFFSKVRGALFLSGRSFAESYKSSKVWQGYLIFLLGIGLFSVVVSISSYPLFTELFPHYDFILRFWGVNFHLSFSPQLFILCFSVITLFLLFISYIIGFFRHLKFKRVFSALGFSVTPLFILIFYLLNKFILQSFKYELGPLLIGIGVGWSFLSGLIGFLNLIGFEIAGLAKYALSSIVYRRKRTYAAVIGIAVAIGLIITPIPIISGYYSQLTNLAQQHQYAQYLVLLENGKSDYYSSFIDSTVLSSLEHPNIDKVSPETYMSVNLSFNSIHFRANSRGINFSLFQNYRPSFSFKILPATSFSDSNMIIGSYLASILGINYSDLPVNASLMVNSNSVNITVIGILTTDIHYDSEIFISINLTRSLNQDLVNKFSLIEVKLKDATQADTTVQMLRGILPQLRVEQENQMSNFVAGIISRTVQSMWLLSIVIFSVMIFGIFHIMHIIVKESEREIRIFKAIGASRFQIVRIFLYQAVLLSLIGSIIGVLGGIFLSYGASYLVSSITTVSVQPAFDLLIVIASLCFGITSGIVGGIGPAYMAAKANIGGKV